MPQAHTSAFPDLFDACTADYVNTSRGEMHLRSYSEHRAVAMHNWAEITRRIDSGEAATDLILKGCLPHTESKSHREGGYWISVASAVQGDIRSWYGASLGIPAEDWPKIARALYDFFRMCEESPANLERAVARFTSSPESKGFQSGLLTPFLHALRPEDYSIINAKPARTLTYLTGEEVSKAIVDYPKANNLLKDFAVEHADKFSSVDSLGASPIQVLDMFSHWLVAVRKFHFGSIEKPISQFFSDRDEADEAFDLIAATLDYLGITDPADSRLAITLPKGGSDLLRVIYGPYSMLTFAAKRRRKGFVDVALLADMPENPYEQGEKVYAVEAGYPAVATYRVPFDDAIPLSPGLANLLQQTCDRITEIGPNWKKSPWAEIHQLRLAQAALEPTIREQLFDNGLSAGYWKIAPGENAKLWEACRDGGYIALGWSEFGDLSGLTKAEFRDLQAQLVAEHADWTVRGTRQLWKFVNDIKPGHEVVANKGKSLVVGIGTVVGDYYFADGERYPHRLKVNWHDTAEREVDQPGWNATLVELDEESYFKIRDAGGTSDPAPPPPPADVDAGHPSTLEDVSAATGIHIDKLQRWVDALNRKRQMILYGPPGTGKTFVASHIAEYLISDSDGFTEFVQFHPAYSYEEFIEGIRPKANENGTLDYPLLQGRFLSFCERARGRKGTCVLVIDEINRANLSRVFGELMYLLEYRDETISLAGGTRFSIPQNVRVIGTMNTADRSIALIDHALRRRFAFIRLDPDYDVLTSYHRANAYDAGPLCDVLRSLNAKIEDPNYAVGITFFLDDDLSDEKLEDIWTLEIEPYLEEYFFDRPAVVDEFRWIRLRDRLVV